MIAGRCSGAMEDVGYMQGNGDTETHVIFVDSSQRDKTVYPSPAEYKIPFDEPLRNVVGVDVLDSVVPSTMYVVDDHNRDMRLYVIATDVVQVARHEALTPHLSSYLKWWLEMEDQPELDAYSEARDNVTSSGRMEIIDERVSTGADGNGEPQYDVVPSPLVDFPALTVRNQRILGVRDISAYPAGRGEPSPGFTEVEYRGARFWIPTGYGYGSERSIIDVDPQGRYIMATLAYVNSASQTGLKIACQRLQFPAGNYGTLALMVAAAGNGNGGPTAVTTTGLPTSNKSYMTSVSTDPDRLLQIRMNANMWAESLGGQAALLAFDIGCGMNEVLGFAGSLTAPGVVKLTPRGARAARMYATNQVGGAAPGDYLYPRGIVNMTGERYIILRCIEVEAGMYSQATTGTRGTGIGLFKLPSPGSLREQRQDYVTIVKRPFHPIGRMDGLTLRLERGRVPGELYNFKGVNHLIVMAVKVLVPKRRASCQASVLNPNYNPDFVQYSLDHIMRGGRGREPLSHAQIERAMRRHELLMSGAEPEGSESGDSDSESEPGAYNAAYSEPS